MKDDIVLSDGPSRNNTPTVILSGLRGTPEEYASIFTIINLSYHDVVPRLSHYRYVRVDYVRC